MRHLTHRAGTLALIAAAGMLIGCTSEKHKGPGRVYKSKPGFSIVPPSGWVDQGESAGAFLGYVGPREAEYSVNLNVNVQRHDGSSVDGFPAQLKPAYAKLFTGYETAYDGFVTIDGKKCYYISSKFQMGQYRLQNLQYFILSGNGRKVFPLTFTAGAENYDKYRALFEETATTARTD